MRLRLLLAFVAVDLNFKLLVGLTFIHVTGSGASLLPTMVAVLAPIWIVWVGSVWWLARSIDGDDVARAGEAADRLPIRLATVWTSQWVVGFTLVMVVSDKPFDLANLCFLATLVSGPIPLAHALTGWLLTSRRRDLAFLARERGIVLHKRVTIRRQLLMYAICIAAAPGTFMAAVGLGARTHMTPYETMVFAVGVGFLAVASFAILNALLVAAVLTRPVVDMTAMLRAIAEQGTVKQGLQRVPQYQRDELGTLVEVANEMLEQLERTDKSREQAHAELEQLTRTLEERIEQETKKLVSTNASLERERSERRMIEHELDVARRIQTSILPQRWDVEGLDIAAAMVTATEIGGDYYDILPRPHGGWIGIGDVSGHGISAGVIMLMVQSITATLVEAFPQASTAELVIALDRILFRNVRHRLKTDDFVTFTLLRYDRDGRVKFAGAHEDLIVWRAATGTCERIPTEGPWIATTGNIAKHVVERELQLQRDDVLVLYTDGVTEARDPQKQQWGIERLCEAIEGMARTESVELIGRRVMETAQRWCATQEDDMSIVVARQRA